jgi:hypothetical protein
MQTGFGVHPTYYPMDTRDKTPEGWTSRLNSNYATSLEVADSIPDEVSLFT